MRFHASFHMYFAPYKFHTVSKYEKNVIDVVLQEEQVCHPVLRTSPSHLRISSSCSSESTASTIQSGLSSETETKHHVTKLKNNCLKIQNCYQKGYRFLSIITHFYTELSTYVLKTQIMKIQPS